MVWSSFSFYTAPIMIMWLLWIIVVPGGLYMGLNALMVMIGSGFDIALALNTIIYLGCALYGLPRLFKLLTRKG